MNYQYYQAARDAAWRLLIERRVRCLPVDVVAVSKQLGYILRSFSQGKKLIDAFGLTDQMIKSDGFTLRHNNRYYIFYDDTTSVERQRFTICHEIWHIRCGHLLEGQYTTLNREPESNERVLLEQMANVFASRFLAPACVLYEMNAVTPEEIATLCGISIQAATFRSERMKKLESRNAFYSSPLEREVYEFFRDFISCAGKGRQGERMTPRPLSKPPHQQDEKG